MSSPNSKIQIGDLVMVIRSCCTMRVRPPIYVVHQFMTPRYGGPGACSNCGKEMPNEVFACPSRPIGQPISWLKRIPPLDELERTKVVEELTEKVT